MSIASETRLMMKTKSELQLMLLRMSHSLVHMMRRELTAAQRESGMASLPVVNCQARPLAAEENGMAGTSTFMWLELILNCSHV